MACNVPTVFPSECASVVIQGVLSKSITGPVVAAGLQVASYIAANMGSLTQNDDGVLRQEAELTGEQAVEKLQTLVDGNAAIDPNLFKPLLTYLLNLALELLKKKLGG